MQLLDKKYIHILFIIATGLSLYLHTLHAPFFLDDYASIVEVPLIKHLSHFLNPGSAHDLRGYAGFLPRYFGYLTFALNYQVNGLNVVGYHLVNIAIHLATALLVYHLVELTGRTFTTADNNTPASTVSRIRFTALFAALLFVAHPLQTQAVTYIVQRLASLAAMLYLLALVCYIRARISQRSEEKHPVVMVSWYLAALVSALLAMRTKQNTYTLPFVIFVYEILFFTRITRKRVVTFFIVACSALVAAAVCATKLTGKSLGDAITYIDNAARVQTDISRLDYFTTQLRVIVTYLRLTLFPVGQRLDYDYPVYHSFLDPEIMMSAVLLCSLIAAALYCLKLSYEREGQEGCNLIPLRVIAFGIFWFFMTLSIESSIIPIPDVIFEHRMYLPSIGLFMAISSLVTLAGGDNGPIPGWPRRSVLISAAVAVLLLSVLTFARNRVWCDEVAFWRDNAEKSPQHARVLINLGQALERKGDLAGAAEAYRRTSEIRPDQTDSIVNLGLIYLQMGRIPEAAELFKSALARYPGIAEAHNNLGKIYGMQGRFDEALKEFLQTVKLNPTQAEPYNNIGYVHALQKRYPEALQAYEKCLDLDPDYELGHFNRGMALLETGRTSEARAEFRRVLEINPSNAKAAEQLQRMTNTR